MMLLFRCEELRLGEGLPQSLLGHQRLQPQNSRRTAVLADEPGAVRLEVNYTGRGEGWNRENTERLVMQELRTSWTVQSLVFSV